MKAGVAEIRPASPGAAVRIAEVAGVSPERAGQIIAAGSAVEFGEAAAVVGFEESRLIGQATRDLFAVDPALLAPLERWEDFESALHRFRPAARLRLTGVWPEETMTERGFKKILFYVEKEAGSAAALDLQGVLFRPVRSALDRAFVRELAVASVYQGMTAAYPGAPITTERMTAYLDGELDWDGGAVSSIICWQEGFPVAHATWVVRTDPVSGSPYVEMWDVDGLWDLRQTGVLSHTAAKAEELIALSGGPTQMRGNVVYEPGWERVWHSLQRQGWGRTTDLWVKYPWGREGPDAQVVVDLRSNL